jgi:hypothetical protein
MLAYACLLSALLCCLYALDPVLEAYCCRSFSPYLKLAGNAAAAAAGGRQQTTARRRAAVAVTVLCSVLLLLSFSEVVLDASGSSSISAQAVPVTGNWLLGNTQNSTMAVLPTFEPTCFPKHEDRVKVRSRS